MAGSRYVRLAKRLDDPRLQLINPFVAMAGAHVLEWRRCPTLRAIHEELGEGLGRRIRQLRLALTVRIFCAWVAVVVPLLFGALLILERTVTMKELLSVPLLPVAVGLVQYLTLIAVALWLRRRLLPVAIPLALIDLVAYMESKPERWRRLECRGRINTKVERLARLYEALGERFRPGDPETAAKLARRSRGAAAGMRELKMWVAQPQDLTYTDMVHRLADDLRTVLDNRWEDLPTIDPPTPPTMPSRWIRILWALSGLVLVALAVAAVAFSARLGLAGPIVVSVLGAAGLLALINAGLPLGKFMEARSAFEALHKGPAK